MSESTIQVAHSGIPCTPPIVNGVEFAPLEADPNVYVSTPLTEDEAAGLLRCPHFYLFDPNAIPAYDLTKPASQWKNTELAAYAKEFAIEAEGRNAMIVAITAHLAAAKAATPDAAQGGAE